MKNGVTAVLTSLVNEENTSPGNGSRGCIFQRVDFEDHPHGIAERHSFVGNKSQDLLVQHGQINGLIPSIRSSIMSRDPNPNAPPLPNPPILPLSPSVACVSQSRQCTDVQRESTHLVVIHNRVHGFDPHGINVPVENHPLVSLVLVETLCRCHKTVSMNEVISRASHDHRQYSPISRRRVLSA